MELRDRRTGRILVNRVIAANTFLHRLRGWMLLPPVSSDTALHITPCRRVHTFFMRFPIDVIYLDASGTVAGIDQALAPNRLGSVVTGTRSVIELPAGRIADLELATGQQLEFQSHPIRENKEMVTNETVESISEG